MKSVCQSMLLDVGLLELTGQFSCDHIGCKMHVKFRMKIIYEILSLVNDYLITRFIVFHGFIKQMS